MDDFLKAERLTSTKWRVLAIPFVGRPKDGKDTDDEFFSPRTDIKAGWFDRRPLIWHHGQDTTMKAEPELGIEDDLEMEPDGWWATAWLDRSHRYWTQIDKWLQEGKMYGSSGTIGHFARKDHKTGEWLVWPHIEQTLTLIPANPFARLEPAKALDHFKSAGIQVDEDLFTEPSESEPASDLPPGGDDVALARLATTLDQLEETLTRLRG
jgi:hypothetical protein